MASVRSAPVLLSAFALAVSTVTAPPLLSAIRSEVEVRIVQVEVAAVPAGEGVACSDLRPEDVELRVNGEPRRIVGLDPLGPRGETIRAPGAAENRGVPGADRPAAQVVLVFDAGAIEWFLCRIPHNPCKPLPSEVVTRKQARRVLFDWAERWLDESWSPGDRWQVVVLAGEPRFLGGWLEDPEDVRLVLRDARENPALWPERPPVPWGARWWVRWRHLLDALETMPGTKHVVWFTTYPPVSHGAALQRLAARCQAARVVIHPVNAFRMACPLRPRGTWAEFTSYVGGEELLEPPVAAEQFREVTRCRFLLSFAVDPRDEHHRWRSIDLEDRTGRFRLRAVRSWEAPWQAPARPERARAMLLLPGFSRGLDLAVRLVPLRPDRRGRRWRGALLVRLRPAPGWEDRSIPARGLVVEMMVERGSRRLASRRLELDPGEVASLGEDPRGRTWVLPVTLQPDRLHDAAVLVHPAGEWEDHLAEIADRQATEGRDSTVLPGAWRRVAVHVPPLPLPGRTGPFFLVDRAGRSGGHVVPVPALGDEVAAGTVPAFMAYECARRGREAPSPPGPLALVPDGSSRPVAEIEVVLSWHPDPERTGCGWWIGRPTRAPGPGAWALVSRDRGGKVGAPPLVRFTVRPSAPASR